MRSCILRTPKNARRSRIPALTATGLESFRATSSSAANAAPRYGCSGAHAATRFADAAAVLGSTPARVSRAERGLLPADEITGMSEAYELAVLS